MVKGPWHFLSTHLKWVYSWLHRPSVLFRISIGTQVACTYITWLSQPIEFCSITTRPSSRGQNQNTKRNSVLLANRLVYIAYEVRISCEGSLRATLYVYCYLENQFYVPWLFTGWWRQYIVRHSTGLTDWVCVYVNISPFEEWLKISSKTPLEMWHQAI